MLLRICIRSLRSPSETVRVSSSYFRAGVLELPVVEVELLTRIPAHLLDPSRTLPRQPLLYVCIAFDKLLVLRPVFLVLEKVVRPGFGGSEAGGR